MPTVELPLVSVTVVVLQVSSGVRDLEDDKDGVCPGECCLILVCSSHLAQPWCPRRRLPGQRSPLHRCTLCEMLRAPRPSRTRGFAAGAFTCSSMGTDWSTHPGDHAESHCCPAGSSIVSLFWSFLVMHGCVCREAPGAPARRSGGTRCRLSCSSTCPGHGRGVGSRAQRPTIAP